MNKQKSTNRQIENDEFFKRIVGLAGDESPSDDFTNSLMQRIDTIEAPVHSPGVRRMLSLPIISNRGWIVAAIVACAFIVFLGVLYNPEEANTGNSVLPNLPRYTEIFSSAINSDFAHIFALVAIIASCLLALDTALSNRKTKSIH